MAQPTIGKSLAVALTFTLMSCVASVAQEIRKTVRGKPGDEIQTAVLGSPRPDCSSGPRPEVRVASPPTHGILRLGQRTLRTSRVQNCPTIEVPVIAVFYKARPGYTGTDNFALDVTPNQGAVQRHVITVEVR